MGGAMYTAGITHGSIQMVGLPLDARPPKWGRRMAQPRGRPATEIVQGGRGAASPAKTGRSSHFPSGAIKPACGWMGDRAFHVSLIRPKKGR